jgi:hypothetical protein
MQNTHTPCVHTYISFAKFLRSPKVRKSVGSFDLVDFLILPIQQIARYGMEKFLSVTC